MCPCPHGLTCTIGRECCHTECLGGCSRPEDPRACVACRHLYFQGACHRTCPAGTYQHESCAVSQPSSAPACALCRAAPPPLASTRAVAWPSALQASPVMAAGECRMGGVTLGAVRRPALVQGSCHTLHLPLLAYSATSARGYAPKSARWAPRPSTPSRRHRIWWAAPMWRGASSSIFARAVSNPLGATPLLLATPLLPATPLTMTQLKARLFITLDPSLVDLPSLDPHSAPPSRPTDRHFPRLQVV